MKTNLIMLLLLLSGFAVKSQTAPTPANTNPNPSATSKSFASAGCVELGGSFSFTSESYSTSYGTNTVNMILFSPYVGYFPVQGFELGLNPISVSSQLGASGGTSLLFVFAPSYNFNTHSNAFPFIEANIGYTTSQNYYTVLPGSGLCYGTRAGVKLVIASHALVNIAAQYLVQTYNSNGFSESNVKNLVIGVGFTVYL